MSSGSIEVASWSTNCVVSRFAFTDQLIEVAEDEEEKEEEDGDEEEKEDGGEDNNNDDNDADAADVEVEVDNNENERGEVDSDPLLAVVLIQTLAICIGRAEVKTKNSYFKEEEEELVQFVKIKWS